MYDEYEDCFSCSFSFLWVFFVKPSAILGACIFYLVSMIDLEKKAGFPEEHCNKNQIVSLPLPFNGYV